MDQQLFRISPNNAANFSSQSYLDSSNQAHSSFVTNSRGMKSNTGQIDNKTSTCIISQLKPLSRPPSVGDRIGVITKNKFFHFGQYASFDDEGDSIYLKNVTSEFLDGNKCGCDEKVYEVVRFTKEHIVGVLFYEEETSPEDTGGQPNNSIDFPASCTQNVTPAEPVAQLVSTVQPVSCSVPIVSSQPYRSNVSLSPLVPRRHEMPPRLRLGVTPQPQTGHHSVSMTQQNANPRKELVQTTAPTQQPPGFIAVRPRRWEQKPVLNAPSQENQPRSRIPTNPIKGKKKEEIRRKWQEKQLGCQAPTTSQSSERTQCSTQNNCSVQPTGLPISLTLPNNPMDVVSSVITSRGGGEAQTNASSFKPTVCHDGAIASSYEVAVPQAVEAAAQLQLHPPFFDQQLTSAISDQFAGVRPCLSANRLQSYGAEAFGSDCNDLITRTKTKHFVPLDETQTSATIYPPLGTSNLLSPTRRMPTPALLPTPPVRAGIAFGGPGAGVRAVAPANFPHTNDCFRPCQPLFRPHLPPSVYPPPFKGFPDYPEVPLVPSGMRPLFVHGGEPFAPNPVVHEQQQFIHEPFPANRMRHPLPASCPPLTSIQSFMGPALNLSTASPNQLSPLPAVNPTMPSELRTPNIRSNLQHVHPGAKWQYSSQVASPISPRPQAFTSPSSQVPSPLPPPPPPPTPNSMFLSPTPTPDSMWNSRMPLVEHHEDLTAADTLKPYGYSLLPSSFASSQSSELLSEGASSVPGTPPPIDTSPSMGGEVYKAAAKAAICSEFKRKVLQSLAASGGIPAEKRLPKREASTSAASSRTQIIIAPDSVSSTESLQAASQPSNQVQSDGVSSGGQVSMSKGRRDELGNDHSSIELDMLQTLTFSGWAPSERVDDQSGGISSSQAVGRSHRLEPLAEELGAAFDEAPRCRGPCGDHAKTLHYRQD